MLLQTVKIDPTSNLYGRKLKQGVSECQKTTVGTDGRCGQQQVASQSGLPCDLVGDSPEISCKIDDISVQTLIDTGSQVTSLSVSCYKQFFSDSDLIDISRLMALTSVSGSKIPYLGYFECSISIPVCDDRYCTVTAPVLVVPDTDYNRSVPFLIGTNVLNKLLNFPAKPTHPSLSTALQTLSLAQRHLNATDGIYGNVLADEDIELRP